MRARTPSIAAITLVTAGCFTPSFVRRQDAATPADAARDAVADVTPDVADAPALDAPVEAASLDASPDVAVEAALDAPPEASLDVVKDQIGAAFAVAVTTPIPVLLLAALGMWVLRRNGDLF